MTVILYDYLFMLWNLNEAKKTYELHHVFVFVRAMGCTKIGICLRSEWACGHCGSYHKYDTGVGTRLQILQECVCIRTDR